MVAAETPPPRASQTPPSLAVQHRARRRAARRHTGADMRIRLTAVLVLAAAEGLGLRQQLNVDLKPDHGLIFGNYFRWSKTGKSRHRRILSMLALHPRWAPLHLIPSVSKRRQRMPFDESTSATGTEQAPRVSVVTKAAGRSQKAQRTATAAPAGRAHRTRRTLRARRPRTSIYRSH